MLADLHVHFNGCLPAHVVLDELVARGDRVRWDWYETRMRAAYGIVPPARQAVERHRTGDVSAADDFEALFVFNDNDGGGFDRFQAKTDRSSLRCPQIRREGCGCR